ncbi:MAG: formyltransferase family protein, partial [Thermoanaerobaculia bacterium]|nr:formyltransferase family protein [Thermoanaerobaculia bacterium]
MNRDNPLRVVVLCSRRAPGVVELLDDPDYGDLFEIVGVISSESRVEGAEEIIRRDVPLIHNPIREVMGELGLSPFDLRHRGEYDRRTLDLLEVLRPDLVVLSSYLYLLSPVILDEWYGRVINVHDSDLTVKDEEGRPRYTGLRSSRDAIFAGEPQTRATVHIVTEELDAGPILFRSEPFPVSSVAAEARAWGDETILKAYARAHRAWMIRAAWGPLLRRAIEIWAFFEILLVNGRLYVNGTAAPLPDVE